jgi:hypothetical protein
LWLRASVAGPENELLLDGVKRRGKSHQVDDVLLESMYRELARTRTAAAALMMPPQPALTAHT